MIKKWLLTLTMIACVSTARAQFLIALVFGDKLNGDKIQFGLTLGGGLTSYTGIDAKYRPSLCFGMYLSYRISDKFSLEPRFLPKYNGGARALTIGLADKYKTDAWDTTDVKQSVGYFVLPLMVGYSINSHFKICIGPQVGMRSSVKNYYTSDDKGDQLKIKPEDTHKLFDAGVSGDIEYNISKNTGIRIIAQYYYGFTNASKIEGQEIHNSIFQFAVGIPVGAGKAKKKAEANQQISPITE